MTPQPPDRSLALEPTPGGARGLGPSCLPWGGDPQFLYSPALLEVIPERDVLMVLAQSIRDPSPAIRVLSLQGLGNILFHPEKVRAGGLWGLESPLCSFEGGRGGS